MNKPVENFEVPPKYTVVMASNDSTKWNIAISTGNTDINKKLIIYTTGTFVAGGYEWLPLDKKCKVPKRFR